MPGIPVFDKIISIHCEFPVNGVRANYDKNVYYKTSLIHRLFCDNSAARPVSTLFTRTTNNAITISNPFHAYFIFNRRSIRP